MGMHSITPPMTPAQLATLKIGNVLAGNYAEFEADGTLFLYGAATAWEDLNRDAYTARPGVTAPTWEGGFRGDVNCYTLNFVHNQADEIQFDVQFRHGMRYDTLCPHVHFSPYTTTTGTQAVRFMLAYRWASIGAQFPELEATFQMTATWNTDQIWYHLLARNASADIAASAYTFSSVMKCRLYRDNTVPNNYAGKVALHYFDIHVENQSFGTRQEYSN